MSARVLPFPADRAAAAPRRRQRRRGRPTAADPSHLARGVFRAPWYANDDERARVLFAIDAHGRRLAELYVPDTMDECGAADALDALLNALDPVTDKPSLTLIR